MNPPFYFLIVFLIMFDVASGEDPVAVPVKAQLDGFDALAFEMASQDAGVKRAYDNYKNDQRLSPETATQNLRRNLRLRVAGLVELQKNLASLTQPSADPQREHLVSLYRKREEDGWYRDKTNSDMSIEEMLGFLRAEKKIWDANTDAPPSGSGERLADLRSISASSDGETSVTVSMVGDSERPNDIRPTESGGRIASSTVVGGIVIAVLLLVFLFTRRKT